MKNWTVWESMGSSVSVAITEVKPVLTGSSLHEIWEIEPIYQKGTPWLSAATPLAIDVIFWISCVKCIFAGLTGLMFHCFGHLHCTSVSSCCLSFQLAVCNLRNLDHSPTKQPEKLYSRIFWAAMMLFGVVLPLLGVFAVLTDSQETLKAFCIISIFSLIFCFIYLAMRMVYGYKGQAINYIQMYVSFLFVGIGVAFHVVGIVFAWQNAFPAQIRIEISRNSAPVVTTTVATTTTTTAIMAVLKDTSFHLPKIYQQGTPWLSTAAPPAINIIFWISCVKFIYAILTSLIIYGLDKHKMFGTTLMLPGLVIPLLGAFSVMTDSQETLKAFCIIIIFSLVGLSMNLGYVFTTNHKFLFLLLIGISFSLHVVPIVFAWPYAFPAKIEISTQLEPKFNLGETIEKAVDFREKLGELRNNFPAVELEINYEKSSSKTQSKTKLKSKSYTKSRHRKKHNRAWW